MANVMKDLTGMRFGKLTAILPTEERKRGYVVWRCRCDCGNIVFVPSVSLHIGNTTSCGCVRAADLTGQRFGKLTVVRRIEERQSRYVVWECKCDCGNITFVPTGSLQSGNTTSCGCIKTLDLTGQRFGKLTVVCRTDERRSKNVVWECKCDCGNIAFVTSASLQSGNANSCGCTKTLDLTGQRFGMLTVVRRTDERRSGNVVWECKCDCGNITFVPTNRLRTGNTKSCGCLKSSNKRKNEANEPKEE